MGTGFNLGSVSKTTLRTTGCGRCGICGWYGWSCSTIAAPAEISEIGVCNGMLVDVVELLDALALRVCGGTA